jgi:glycosyltransferase involved in cell wall biosynthesis
MKILLMITLMDVGGAQKAILQLARGLKERGHQVTVVAFYDKTNVIPHFERTYGLKIVDLKMRRPHRRLIAAPMVLPAVFRLFRLMRHGKYDVLQTFGHYCNVLGLVLGLFARIPVRVSSQRYRLDLVAMPMPRLDRIVANSPVTHRMVAVSDAIRRYCVDSIGIRSDKVVAIHNAVAAETDGGVERTGPSGALRAEFGLEQGTLVITIVARLIPEKGHRHLLQALEHACVQIPALRLLVVGDGPLWEDLRHQVERLHLDHSVHLLGMRHDVAEILAISDLFVLPSLTEGLSNAILEAMAAGVPVIATDVDGSGELVVDGETGLLVPPGDVEALTRAICRLAANEPTRRAMSEASRRRIAQQFSVDRFVDSFERLYRDLSSPRTRGLGQAGAAD